MNGGNKIDPLMILTSNDSETIKQQFNVVLVSLSFIWR